MNENTIEASSASNAEPAMRGTVVTFGETMLRLSPPGQERLALTTALDVHVGGTESNVACVLAQLDTPASWVSRLPENALGRLVQARLRQAGVDTSGIRWTEDGRLGLYFVEHGSDPRPTRVLYDREGSSFAVLNPSSSTPTPSDARW